MSELKPCPFCGKNGNTEQTLPECATQLVWWVGCESCGFSNEGYISEDYAIKAWNTRHEEG